MFDFDKIAVDRTASRILFVAMFVVAFLMFVLWRTENPRLQSLRNGVIDSVSGTLEAIAGPSAGFASLFADFQTMADLEAENAQLRRNMVHLKDWRDAVQRLEAENARLRALNDVRLPPRMAFVTAEVISDSRGPYSHSVIVNVGKDDRVVEGAPALDENGLVGRVVALGETSARILLLTDKRSRVPVFVGDARRRAILQGDHSNRPTLRFLSSDVEVGLGEQVTTSGDGGVFPAGLRVGRVDGVEGLSPAVRLDADYRRLQFMKVRFNSVEERVPSGGGLIMRVDDLLRVDPATQPVLPAPAPLLGATPTTSSVTEN